MRGKKKGEDEDWNCANLVSWRSKKRMKRRCVLEGSKQPNGRTLPHLLAFLSFFVFSKCKLNYFRRWAQNCQNLPGGSFSYIIDISWLVEISESSRPSYFYVFFLPSTSHLKNKTITDSSEEQFFFK